MKFTSPIFSQASGSLNGMTFSHNRGGMYVRQRATPTDPNSPEQSEVRSIFASLTQAWNMELSAAEIAGWNVYADNVPVIDTMGRTIFLTGLQHYIRSNVPRVQAALARVDTPPGDMVIGQLTQPTVAAPDVSAGNAAVSFTNTDQWAGATGGALLIFASRPQSATINFFRGPYRLAGLVAGAAMPPTSPATVTMPFAPILARIIFFRFRGTSSDGRLSYPAYFRSPACVA